MTTRTPNRRWYHLTPDRLFIGLLVVQVFLFLSDRFDWLSFNEHKGWTVLIAVGVVCIAVVVMLIWGLACLCLRRRFQFGIRSLLVFLVTVNVPLGWFAGEMQRARGQREVVEALNVGGGKAGTAVGYECEFVYDEVVGGAPPPPRWLEELLGDDFFYEAVAASAGGLEYGCNAEFGDDDARLLERIPTLKYLSLEYTLLTDSGVEHLVGLVGVEDLRLDGTQITDDGLAHLKNMTRLRVLLLSGTQATDSGLAYLKGMTALEILSLDRTQVTDHGLAHLEGMTKLEMLELNHTRITDNGLKHLEGMTSLEMLSLYHTQVTEEGANRLQVVLPNCMILHIPSHHDHRHPPIAAHLEALAELEWLSLEGTQTTDEGVKKLQQRLPDCKIEH